jgi:hypothetical protein
MYIDSFNGESDSCWGANAFSVQLNTNTFSGSNGQTDWDQFVLQNGPNASNNCDMHGPLLRTCIWQNDVTTQSYNYDCVPVPSQALYTGYVAYFNASVRSGTISFVTEILLSNGTYKSYSVSQSDNYGLSSHWYDASGTVLGFGGGSEAEFTASATVYADLGIARFTNASAESDTNTAEYNNLAYTYHDYIGCSSNICFEDTTSST